jgi:DNA-directed RNA polymerase specialized sigma24 family protein
MKDATNAIVRNYSALTGWLEAQELRQQAELAKLEVARTWKPGGAPLVACQNAAMKWALWRYVRWARGPVYANLGHRAGTEALDACRSVDLLALRGQPDIGDSHEDHLDKRRMANIITRMLALMPSGELAGEVLLGERKPAEVAQERKVPVREVYQAVQDAKRKLKGSRRLRQFVAEYFG